MCNKVVFKFVTKICYVTLKPNAINEICVTTKFVTKFVTHKVCTNNTPTQPVPFLLYGFSGKQTESILSSRASAPYGAARASSATHSIRDLTYMNNNS